MFQLLPAVDVADGVAVRLVQGEAGTETPTATRWPPPWPGGRRRVVDPPGRPRRRLRPGQQPRAARAGRQGPWMSTGAVRRNPRRRLAAAALATGCRRVNIGTRGAGAPAWCAGRSPSTGIGSRWAWTSAAPRWPPGLDPRGRRPVRGAGEARCRGLCPLRRHRCASRWHHDRPQRRSAARRLRRDGSTRGCLGRRQQPGRPRAARPAARPGGWRERSSARRCTRAPSRCPRRCRRWRPSPVAARCRGDRRVTLSVRVIPCLDVDDGRVVKGVNFVDLRDAGDPVALARAYGEQGADELVFLDITASSSDRSTMLDVVSRTAEEVFIPLTVGGGCAASRTSTGCCGRGRTRSASTPLRSHGPSCSERRPNGSVRSASCSASTPAACRRRAADCQRLRGHHPWRPAGNGLDAISWIERAVGLGAGEVLLNSMDADGTKAGFDTAMIAAARAVAPVPVIASGGAGAVADFAPAVAAGRTPCWPPACSTSESSPSPR